MPNKRTRHWTALGREGTRSAYTAQIVKEATSNRWKWGQDFSFTACRNSTFDKHDTYNNKISFRWWGFLYPYTQRHYRTLIYYLYYYIATCFGCTTIISFNWIELFASFCLSALTVIVSQKPFQSFNTRHLISYAILSDLSCLITDFLHSFHIVCYWQPLLCMSTL
jgi:hypothetical protein